MPTLWGRCLSSAETKAGKCAKECSHYVEKIASTFQVDVSHDDASTHPPTYVSFLLHFSFSFSKTNESCPRLATPFKDRYLHCRRKKQKNPGCGRPRAPPAYLEHFSSLPPSPTVSRDKIPSFEPLSSTDPIECKICNKLLDNALETPCMHLFCCECLTAHFETFGEPTAPCPTCQAPMHFKNITAPRGYFASLFLSTVMKCKACKVNVTVGEINHHVCVSCMSSIPNTNSVFLERHFINSSTQPSEITQMLMRPLTAPLTTEMEALGSHILQDQAGPICRWVFNAVQHRWPGKFKNNVKHLQKCLPFFQIQYNVCTFSYMAI